MTNTSAHPDGGSSIEPGLVVYDGDGVALGVVSGFTDDGFEVAIVDDVDEVDQDGRATVEPPETESEQARKTSEESLRTSEQQHQPGQEFGEGFLMWRCENCGEMGELDEGLPEACPNCGSENVNKWKED